MIVEAFGLSVLILGVGILVAAMWAGRSEL